MKKKALSIIESYCGQLFSTQQVTERIELRQNIGKLNHNPILRVDDVKARATEWAQSDVFGASGWVNICPEDITFMKDYVEIPGGVLDVNWNEAEVVYTIGYEELPKPIDKACKLLTENLISHKDINSYKISALLTEEIIDLITPFMKAR